MTEDRLREIDTQRALGAVVAVDPDEADEMGLFEETALSLEDALAARFVGGGVPAGDGVEIPVASAAEVPEKTSADANGEDAGPARDEDDRGGYEMSGGGNGEFAVNDGDGKEGLDNGQGR